jgi:hypothetical protein
MSSRRLLPLLAIVFATACSDTAAEGETSLPTAPEPAADLQSSTCRAYATDLAAAEAALTRTPNDPALQERVAAFRAIIDDACN